MTKTEVLRASGLFVGFLVGALLVALCVPGGSPEAGPAPSPTVILQDAPQLHASAAAAEVGERIVELPDDGDVWHTSVFVHAQWQSLKADRELVAAFETDPRLVSLKAQTKFHLFTDADPTYKQRFAKHVPTLPAILVQRGNGEVIYKASSTNIDPPALGGQVAAGIHNWRCDQNGCYPVQPQPAPAPPPLFNPPLLQRGLQRALEPVPDVMPALTLWGKLQTAISEGKWLLALGLIAAIAWRYVRPPVRTVYRTRRKK